MFGPIPVLIILLFDRFLYAANSEFCKLRQLEEWSRGFQCFDDARAGRKKASEAPSGGGNLDVSFWARQQTRPGAHLYSTPTYTPTVFCIKRDASRPAR